MRSYRRCNGNDDPVFPAALGSFFIYATARQDLCHIVAYLNTLSPKTAEKYYDQLIRKIADLAQFPERHPHPRDLALKVKGYRYLLVKNYYVFLL